MPQELKQVNGRWVVTGDLRSSDLVPQAPTQRIKPVAVKREPSQGKPQKPWWAQLQNDVKYELNQLGKDPLSSLDRATLSLAKATNYVMDRTIPGIAFKGTMLGYYGAQDNFNRLAYSAVQRLQGRKKADSSAGRYGEYLDRKIDSIYRSLGAKPPSQMTQAEREGDQFLRSIVGNVMAEGVTGKMQAAMQATTLLGRTLRGGAAFALNEALSTAFEDNTGGNPVNALNMIPGVKLPGAVNVGQDDMLDAYLKSIVPNAATGLAVGAAAGGAVMAAQKVAGFRNIRRNIRAQRAVQREAQERAKQEAMGFLQKDEAGGHGFTPQAQQPPEPAAPITPQPTVAEETLAAVDALRQRIRGGAGEAVPGAAAAPRAPEPAPTQPAAAIPTAPMEAGGAVRNPDQPLPQADPATNYWDYDQSLPESTALGRSLSELSDREITTVLNNPGLPVVERVNQVIEARSAIGAPPPLSAQLVMAPKGRLADDYLDALSRTPSALTSREDYELRPLFDPEANPDLWRRAQAISGVDYPSQLSKADMLDTLRAMEGDGMVPIANRLMGAQMMPTGDIAAAPKVFQYKGGVDEQGQQLGNSLEGLERWDPAAEGIVQVWRDTTGEIGPAGQVYVVNGHNRLAAAKRMGIPSLRVEFLDAPTAAEARLAGAVANVSSGSGTVFDAAKLAREYGINTTADLKKLGKPQASGFWRDGIALSRLPEDVFQGAVNASDGQLKLYRLIGESGASPEIMRSAHIYITKNPKADAADLVEMIDYAKANQAQNAAAQSGRQGVLEFEDWDSSYNEQMLAMNKLAVEVNSLLGKEKRLFRQTGKNANALESVANVDAAAATAVGNEAARAQQVFKDMKYVTGPINDLLKEGADRVMRGEAAGAVAQGVKNRMAAEVNKLMGQEVAPVTDVVQEDMFAAAGRAADAPPPAADLTPQQRLAAEAQLLHEGIAGGELRPPSTPLPELPEPARVRLDQVDLDQPVTPGSPTAQAIADEVRLAVEHKQMDAEMGWLQEQAGRDATNYHDLTFDQKQEIRNAVAGVPEAAMPPANSVAGKKVLKEISDLQERIRFSKDERLPAARQNGNAEVAQQLEAAIPKWEKQLADLQAKYGIEPAALAPAPAPLEIPAAAGRKITAKTDESNIRVSAELLASWTRPPGGAPMSLEKALALVRAKGARLDVEKIPWINLDKALNDQSMGRVTPETEAVAAAYRQFYGVEAPRSAALAPAPARPEPVRLTEAAQQPEFLLSNDLSKSTPRYGRYTVAFESDLDRAAYVLANDAVKPSKAADKFRQLVKEAGLELDAVVTHGKRVKAALKQVAKEGDVSGRLELPAQPWRGGRGGAQRVAQRSVSETEARIAEIEGKLAALRQAFDAENAATRADVTKRMPELLDAWRKVVGDDVRIRVLDTNKVDKVSAAWGGGEGDLAGMYQWWKDTIHLYRQVGEIEGKGIEEPFDRLLESGFHEGFHRIARMALSDKDMAVLNTKLARLRVKHATADYGIERANIAYDEMLTEAAARVLVARSKGEDPIRYILKNYSGVKDEDLATPAGKAVYKAAEAITGAVNKVLDLVERTVNLFQGRGFESISSVFERAARGEMTGTVDAYRPNRITGGFRNMYGLNRETKIAYWEDYNLYGDPLKDYRTEKQGFNQGLFDENIRPTKAGIQRTQRQIDANNQAMDDIRRKAQQEGC